MSSVSDIKLIRTDFFFVFFLEILFSQCAKGHTLQHYLQCYKKVLTVASGLQEFVTSGKTVFTIFTIFFFLFFLSVCFYYLRPGKPSTYKVHYFLLCFFLFFLLCFYFLKLGDDSVTVKVAKGGMTPQVFKLRWGKPI